MLAVIASMQLWLTDLAYSRPKHKDDSRRNFAEAKLICIK